MDDRRPELDEEVLAPALGTGEHLAVQQRGRLGEPALRAGHAHRTVGERELQFARQPVCDMAFRHPGTSLS